MTAQLTERAYKHWASVAKRCIARSHPGVSKKKRASRKSIPLVDLLNNEVRAERAERAAVRARTIRDFDMSDSSDGEESEEDEDDDVELPDTEALVTAHGAFVPPDGYKAMKAPDSILHANMHREMVWHDKKVAHIWDSGWLVGTFQGKHTGRAATSSALWEVYYSDDRRVWTHSLRLEEYGCEGTWVIIQKLKSKGNKRKRTE